MLGVVDLQWLQWLLDIIAPKNASWTLTVFHLTPVIVFAVTAFVAMWRFTIFRMREPAINIELDVTSRPSSPSYNGITAVAILTNPSRVVAKCTTLIWQVRVLAPYTDEDVESKLEEYWDYYEREVRPVEFPWNVNYHIERPDSQIALEPGEVNTITMNLAIPSWIEAVDVQLFLEAPGNAKRAQIGWTGRCAHKMNEVPNGNQDR